MTDDQSMNDQLTSKWTKRKCTHSRHVFRINMELCRASDVMTSSPDIIYSQEIVAKLAKVLLRTGHSGFPVVKYDEETKTEVAYGLITRSVCSLVCSEVNRPNTMH